MDLTTKRLLPRVPVCPILAEDNLVNTAITFAETPLAVPKKFMLKDKPAPDFTLTDQNGQQCCLHDTMKLGRPIILFFFPLAGSPHCTRQTCLLRDALQLTPIFDAMQAIVIGISQDSPQRSKKFAKEHQLSYPILHDHKRKVMEMYGVGRTMFGLVNNRATFIIDPSGIVRGLAEAVFNSKGHLKFAEQWLTRLEQELSERIKQYIDYVAQDGDMIADMQQQPGQNTKDRVIQVIYEQQQQISSAKDGTAASNTSKTLSRPAGGAAQKNKWTNWKLLFSQLSPPRRQVAPPYMTASSRDTAKNLASARNSTPKAILGPSRAVSEQGDRFTPENIMFQQESDGIPLSSPLPQAKSPDQQVWVHPLNASVKAAGWAVGDSVSHRGGIPTTPQRVSSSPYSRLDSQSCVDVSRYATTTTTSSNPLVAAIHEDAAASNGPLPVTSEVIKGEESVDSSSPPSAAALAAPLLSILAPPLPRQYKSDHNSDASDKHQRKEATPMILRRPSADLSDVLKSFPTTPTSLTRAEEKPMKVVSPSIRRRRASFDGHSYHLLKKPSLDLDTTTAKAKPMMSTTDSAPEELPRRLSIDSDSNITVSGKHTSFDQHHHQPPANAQRQVKMHKEAPAMPISVVTTPVPQKEDTNSLLLKSFLINENSSPQQIKNHQILMMMAAMLSQLSSTPQDTTLDLD